MSNTYSDNNKYNVVAQNIEDAIMSVAESSSLEDFNTKIDFATNNLTSWQDVVEDSIALQGVAYLVGGSTMQVANAINQTNNMAVDFLIPNETNNQFNIYLQVIELAFTNILGQNTIDFTNDIQTLVLQIIPQGFTNKNFIIVNGKSYGVVTFSFVLSSVSDLVFTRDAYVNLKVYGGSTMVSLDGLIQASHSFEYTYESQKIKGSTEQVNYAFALNKSLHVEFVKIASNTIHRLFNDPTNRVWVITYYDGDANIFTNETMQIAKITQNNLGGGVATLSVDFIGGVS